MKKSVAVVLCLSLFSLAFIPYNLQADDLFDLQKKIKQQQQENQRNHKQLDKINTELGKIELQQSEITLSLRDLDQQIQQNSKNIIELEQQKKVKQQQIKQNQKVLEGLLEFIYKNYSDDAFFDQFIHLDSDPKTQFIIYFKYLNEQIDKNLTQIEQENNNLNALIDEIKNKQQNLSSQQQKQQQQNTQLIELKAKNITLTQDLKQLLSQGDIKLDSLINNERRLNAEIENIKNSKALAKAQREQEKQQQKQLQEQQKLAKSISFKGLNANVSYKTPLKDAKILHNFGSPQIGEMRYKGIVYKAKRGEKVYAIEDGRVVLSNWINGYGLVVLLDHGNDYLSLYGYNQTVLVKLNQLVKKGQPIAEAGSSGGNGESALYFEIRHRGVAKNPNIWIKN